jgi:uncharacterized protein (TIGR03435 family)
LDSILAEAFRTQGYLITGRPDRLSSERYEIIAAVPPGATRDDIQEKRTEAQPFSG